MTNEVASIALTILGSIGTAGVIVLALSSWLGKVWAERLLENERQKNKIELTKITTDFEKENQRVLLA